MTNILLCILGALAVFYIAEKILFSIQFKKQVKEVFAQSKSLSDKKFSYKQLIGLPDPVQRYFKHVLKEGQPYISNVTLTHDGQFKIGSNKNWMDIEGVQYYSADKPAYIWKGRTAFFTARDMYIINKGRLIVSLLEIINIVDAKGENYNEAELQRWVAENVWFPTNLLPNENLNWLPIDSQTAKLSFDYNGISFFFIVAFNEMGEIAQMETQRYMTDKKRETWVCKLIDYKELNGIIVPTLGEVLWKLKTGDFCYAKFKLKTIDYN